MNAIQFALVGDNPYGSANIPKYENLIKNVNDTRGIQWVVHVGDMKSSGTTCNDEMLGSLSDLNRRFDAPFVLTPGDNDWFDCKRVSAGGWNRLDRLAKIRALFYPDPVMAGSLEVNTQASSENYPAFVENVYWQQNNVVFATIHIVGLNGEEGGLDIHEAMMDAGLAWLDTVFAQAHAINAKGVFIATHTNPYPFSGERNWLKVVCPECFPARKHYERLNEALVKHVKRFKLPVLLAVGDTHTFRVDKPLYDDDQLVSNFTRVETFGESEVHWVRVVVDPSSKQVFEIHQEIVVANTPPD